MADNVITDSRVVPSPPSLPVAPPITPVRGDRGKENETALSPLCSLPCFRLVTPEGLQVVLEPMDSSIRMQPLVGYQLKATPKQRREGRKRRDRDDYNDLSPSKPHTSSRFAALNGRLRSSCSIPCSETTGSGCGGSTSPVKDRALYAPLSPPSAPSASSSCTSAARSSCIIHTSSSSHTLRSLSVPSSAPPSSPSATIVIHAAAARTPSRKPLLPRFPPLLQHMSPRRTRRTAAEDDEAAEAN